MLVTHLMTPLRLPSISLKCICISLSPGAASGPLCRPSASISSIVSYPTRCKWGSAHSDSPHSKQIRNIAARGTSLSKRGRLNQRQQQFKSYAASGHQLSDLSNKISQVVEVRYIVVPSDQVAVLDEIEIRLARGEDFATLAKEHLSDAGSDARGGNMAGHDEGRDPVLEEAAYDTDIGDVFRIETAKGLHLVQVTAKRAEVQQMSVATLSELLAGPADGRQGLQLIDVREDGEYAAASLPAFQLLPLSRQEEWAPMIDSQLDPTLHTLVLCHHGVRSNMVANFLTVSKGFQRVHNIVGGIDAYSGIDSSVPRY